MYSSGFSIMRWQSSVTSTAFRKDATTGGPMVMLGTKCPSITSTWRTVAPPCIAALASSARRAKSADKMEGAISIKTHFSREVFSGDFNTQREPNVVPYEVTQRSYSTDFQQHAIRIATWSCGRFMLGRGEQFDISSTAPLLFFFRSAARRAEDSMKVLVLGSGGREHALVWKLRQSPR